MDFIHFWFGSFHKYKSYCRVRDRFVLLDSKTASSNTRHRCQSGQYVPDPNGNYDSLQAGPRYACQNNQCVTSANGPYANITECQAPYRLEIRPNGQIKNVLLASVLVLLMPRLIILLEVVG